jgi:hypothetical protein
MVRFLRSHRRRIGNGAAQWLEQAGQNPKGELYRKPAIAASRFSALSAPFINPEEP